MGGVFVDPAGMDLVDRNGVEEVSFDAAVALRGDRRAALRFGTVLRP